MREWNGTRVMPPSASVYNPSFDVTPAELITAIITDEGIVRPPYVFVASGNPGGVGG